MLLWYKNKNCMNTGCIIVVIFTNAQNWIFQGKFIFSVRSVQTLESFQDILGAQYSQMIYWESFLGQIDIFGEQI